MNWQKKVIFEYHNLPEYLARFGHKVMVVDYDESYTRSGFFDLGTLSTQVFEHAQRAYGDGDITLYRPGQIKLPVLSRVSSSVLSYSLVRRLIQAYNIDAVFLYSVPTNGLGTVLAAHNAGVPVIFRTIDILHELVPYRLLRFPTLFFEKMIYPLIDKIAALTPKLGEYTVRLGAKEDRVELLLPGIDTDVFFPDERDPELMKRWGIKPDDRVVLFLGTLFDFCGMDIVIEGFKKVTTEIPGARLFIVGGGPLLEKLKKRARELGLDKVAIFTGFQPYADMPRYIRLAHLSVNPFHICPATREIIPTKLLQYLGCAVPLLATPLPGTLDILEGEDQGVIYNDITNGFTEKIIGLLKDSAYLELIGKKGRSYVLANHDWAVLARTLEDLIVRAVKDGVRH